jgi:hypothetical protein
MMVAPLRRVVGIEYRDPVEVGGLADPARAGVAPSDTWLPRRSPHPLSGAGLTAPWWPHGAT